MRRSTSLILGLIVVGGCSLDLSKVDCSLQGGVVTCTDAGLGDPAGMHGMGGFDAGGSNGGAGSGVAGQSGNGGASGVGGSAAASGVGGASGGAGIAGQSGGMAGSAGQAGQGTGGGSGMGAMAGHSGAGGAAGNGGADAGVGLQSHLIGMNVGKPVYYGASAPFNDVFKQRDPGQTTDGSTWDTNHESTFQMDAQGYPKSAPQNSDMLRYSAFTALYTGDYSATWSGTGTVTFGGVSATTSAHGAVLHLTKGTAVFVRIDVSSAADPIKNIQILQPGAVSGEFHPDFLAQMNGMSVLRFMDWGDTNNSGRQHSTDLPVDGGPNLSYALMARTANAAHADAWINIPAQADDSLVMSAITQMSAIQGHVYVEWSNEVWNGQFSQLSYAESQGLAAGLNNVGAYAGASSDSGAKYWAGLKYQARRSAQVHQMFRAALGTKVIAVLCGQSSYLDVNSKLLDFYEDTTINPLGGKPDALCVAPYMGQKLDNGYSATTTAQILLDLQSTIPCNTTGDPSVVCDTRANKMLAMQHGVRLITYEAGQHLAAFGSNASTMTPLFIATNRDAGIGPVYTSYLNSYFSENDDLLMLFNSAGEPYGSSGSWPHMEAQTSIRAGSPKMNAVWNFLNL